MRTATSIEESRKLLSLGIDPETADMVYIKGWEYPCCRMYVTSRFKPDVTIPAWSLSALCDLLPTIELYKDSVGWEAWSIELVSRGETPFVALIDLIEQLVEQGYIKTKKL